MVGGPLDGALCQVIKGSRGFKVPVFSPVRPEADNDCEMALRYDMLVYERAPLRAIDGPALFRVKR
jgi:hypothetical protein